MAKRKSSDAAPAADTEPTRIAAEPAPTTDAAAAVETPTESNVATDANIAAASSAAAEPATGIETSKITDEKITDDTPKAEPAASLAGSKTDDTRPGVTARLRQPALLAASLALAVALGAIAGAAGTFAVSPPAAAPAATTALSDELADLRETVDKLGRDLAGLKSGIDAVGRNAQAQLRQLADRIDHSDKAQAEPNARIAKITETLERLERRFADVTGAVTNVAKQQAKPPQVEGWTLVDFYAGRALLASRSGALYEVRPGSNLPGVGKVEAIKREDNRVVVVTPKGVIAAAIERPRPPRYFPYRY